jgi:hypothetical protein
MSEILEKARGFIMANARLLERRMYEVCFEGVSPEYAGRVVKAYQNPDGGLGHALEPDERCPSSQPLFAAFGLTAMEEAGYRDKEFALSLCDYLQSVADENGLVPFFTENVFDYPIAGHWVNATIASGFNPTAEICGMLYYQGVEHVWLSTAAKTCCDMFIKNPPREAHELSCAARLAQYLPDRRKAGQMLDIIAEVLPSARFYIPDTPVNTYGLTPLHFSPRPDSICRPLFTQRQIDDHLEELLRQQQPDGGWPVSWDAPGDASVTE